MRLIYWSIGLMFSSCCIAQNSKLVPVNDIETLRRSYTGEIKWEQPSKTVTFLTSGKMYFRNRNNFKNIYWGVPEDVRRIVIEKNVTVNGHFHVRNNLTIEGRHRETSKVFGTSVQHLLRNNNLDKDGGTPPYSAFYASGDLEMNIANLTSVNPIGFHFTGKNGAKIHLSEINALDNRGGSHNHSDGISAAAGSTVKNCYFSTGDDVIKVYADILVENTEIHMIQNSVPIQFGWGNYGSNAKGTFKNLTITGSKGRKSTGNAIIDARKGFYNKEILIDGFFVSNSNATLFDFWNEGVNGKRGGGMVKVKIKNASIAIGQFRKYWNMDTHIIICDKIFTAKSIDTHISCREDLKSK